MKRKAHYNSLLSNHGVEYIKDKKRRRLKKKKTKKTKNKRKKKKHRNGSNTVKFNVFPESVKGRQFAMPKANEERLQGSLSCNNVTGLLKEFSTRTCDTTVISELMQYPFWILLGTATPM